MEGNEAYTVMQVSLVFVIIVIFIILLPHTLEIQCSGRYNHGKLITKDKLQYERTVVHDEYHTDQKIV